MIAEIHITDETGRILGRKRVKLYLDAQPQSVDEYQLEVKAVEAYRDARYLLGLKNRSGQAAA